MSALSEQIYELLDERIVDPAELLLGLDLGEQLRARAETRAELYAAQLVDPDRRVAAQTAIDIAVLLPDQIPAGWWTTPLGQAVALTYEVSPVLSVQDAARALGVSREAVYQAVRKGQLERVDGGVTVKSVLARMAGMGPQRWRGERASVAEVAEDLGMQVRTLHGAARAGGTRRRGSGTVGTARQEKCDGRDSADPGP